MKALGGSYVKFLLSRHRDERVLFWSREIAQRRLERGSLHQKRVSNGLFLDVSSGKKRVLSISASSSSAQTNDDEAEEIRIMHLEDQQKTVHVRLKLHKECAFGHQFLVVGDDTMVGLWDPSNGVPLIWSEGHVWTAEVDIPSGKEIKYKFILKGVGESITWQPGPDRILITWLTDKVITVYEDWDTPELQKIVEEEFEAEIKDESLLDSNLSMEIGENLNGPMSNEEDAVINEPNGDNIDTIDLMGPQPQYVPMFVENITEGFEGRDICANDKGRANSKENGERKPGDDNDVVNDGIDFLISKDEEKSLVLYEEIPVLVPGLMSTPLEEIEEEAMDESKKDGNVEKRVDEFEDCAEQESEGEHAHAAMLQETSETALNIDRKEQTDGSDHILDGDLQWGRRTLQKLLANLGFQ